MRDYTKIDAWKLADDCAVEVYGITKCFPRDEMYGLTSQLRRAASSVPANIAEGSARDTKRDYLHFLYIARGSLTEVQYFLHLANRLEYLPGLDHTRLAERIRQAFACLHGLIKAVEQEAGKLAKLTARITSLLVLSIAQWSVIA